MKWLILIPTLAFAQIGRAPFYVGGAAEASTPSLAIDALGPNSSGAGGANPTSPITWTHVSAGNVLYVGICVGVRDGDADFVITGVTYNGVPMTFLASKHGPIAWGYVQLWRLISPASGSHTVSVSFTNGSPDVRDGIECGSISFSNANASPEHNTDSTNGQSTTPSINISSATGEIVLDVAGGGSSISSSGQTLQWNLDVNGNTGGGNGAQSTAAGGATVTMSYTMSGSDDWAIIGTSVRP